MLYNSGLKIVLIPAYEPGNSMLNLLEEACKSDFHSIVVDDGSGNEYTNIFDKAAKYAEVISYPENQGKGYALKKGMEYISQKYKGDFVVVTMDSDGQHSFEDAKRICLEAKRNDDNLVLGKRELEGEIPARSRFGNSLTRFIFKLSTGKSIYDTQTGLRAFSNKTMPFLMNIMGNRYEYEMNVLLECCKKDIPIKEVDIDTIYIDNNSGSHFHAIKDSIRIYKCIAKFLNVFQLIKFCSSSFISFVLDCLLYIAFLNLTSGMAHSITLSNTFARIISSIQNFEFNRRFVFNKNDDIIKSAVQYAVLATVILTVNTTILNFLALNIGINKVFAKILTELLLFILSWSIQKLLIFKKDVKKSE